MKTIIPARNSQGGIMLMESLIYMAVFSVILTLGIFGYNRFQEQSSRLRGVAEDIARAVNAGERWRADIRNASGRLEYNSKTGELRIPQTSNEIVYRFSEGTIHRRVGTQFVPVLKNVKASSMQKTSRQHVTSWRWEVELKTRGKNAKLQPLFQFEAVVPNQS